MKEYLVPDIYEVNFVDNIQFVLFNSSFFWIFKLFFTCWYLKVK